MKKVMIVDDSVMMRTVIKNTIMSNQDLNVVDFAENGQVALEKLKEHPDLDLILLDIEMPVMYGIEFLPRAKLTTKAKIIVLSSVALTGSEVSSKVRSLGADAIVTKPSGAVSFDLAEKKGSELLMTIDSVLG